ncbi:MAG: hypothetical protein ACYC57_07750 [Thermoleophilia bacterium]
MDIFSRLTPRFGQGEAAATGHASAQPDRGTGGPSDAVRGRVFQVTGGGN